AEPAGRDDPGELYARLADLRERVDTTRGEPVGTPSGGWQTVGRDRAARELADRGAPRGVDLDTARGMVTDYLADTTARAGAPAWQWGLDQGDIDAIAAHHGLPAHLDPISDGSVVSCGNYPAEPAAYPAADSA